MINRLLKAIQVRLAQDLAQLPLPAAGGEGYATPQVFLGGLPPREPDQPPPCPYLVLRARSGSVDNQPGPVCQRVEVSLLCGVYAEGGAAAGQEEVLNLVHACLTALRRAGTLDECFELRRQSWSQPEEQSPPYYQAQVDTRWRFRLPEVSPGPEQEVETYGSGYRA